MPVTATHPALGEGTIVGWQGQGDKPARAIFLDRAGRRHKVSASTLGVEPRTGAESVEPGGEETLDEVLDAAAARDRELQHRREMRRLLAAEERMRRLERALARSCSEYEPTPLARIPDRSSKPQHEDILVLSDWHVGLQMSIEESGGLYSQTVETTRKQVAKIWRAVEHLHLIEASGRHAEKLHILFIGDIVEGDGMRPSQSRKIEDVVTVQAVQGFDLLAWVLRMALQVYPAVEIDLVGGNHDRTSQKAGDGGLGELDYVDNYTWLCGAFIERILAADVDSGRLKVRNWSTFFGFKEIQGQKVVFEHGSSFKWSAGSYGGVPWYAIQNQAPKYTAMLGAADLVCIGHGHRPALIPYNRGWILSNGALPATSTYIQAGMKVISRPLQWKMSVHREHGIIGWQPLYADVPEALLPGAVWEDPEHYADLATARAPAPAGPE